MPRCSMMTAGLLVAVVAASWPCRGERIEFVRGGRVDAAVTVEGDQLIVDHPFGRYVFDRGDVRSIEPGHWPPSEWDKRWEKARRAGPDTAFAAAWWALEHGLTHECAAALRAIHEDNPDHQPTSRMVEVLDGLARPCQDPDTENATALLRRIAKTARSEHIVLVHQLDDEEARARLDLLEHVLTAFYLNLTAYGIDLDLPATRAVLIWMPDRDSYRTVLSRAGAADFGETRGYFHPTLRVVLTYDGRSEPENRHAQRRIDRRRDECSRLRRIARSREPSSILRLGLPGEPPEGLPRDEALAALDALQRDLQRQQLLLDIERLDIEYAAAAHELIHLLVRSSGLASEHDTFPVWLHEGLAMQFEVIRSGRWAGVGRVDRHRLAYWPGPQAPPSLVKVIQDQGFGAGYRPEAYASAWALVYFLRKEHPAAFLAMLDRLRHPGASSTPTDRASQAFTAIFGPRLDPLEADWHQYIQRLSHQYAAELSPK